MADLPALSQGLDQKLLESGSASYGGFGAEIFPRFLQLQPYMTDPNASLAELVGAVELVCNKVARADGSDVDSEFLSARAYDAIATVLADYSNRFAMISQRIAQHRTRPDQPLSISPGDLEWNLREALSGTGIVAPPKQRPDSVFYPSMYGRRVWTGETERPGSDHGYDPCSLPPA